MNGLLSESKLGVESQQKCKFLLKIVMIKKLKNVIFQFQNEVAVNYMRATNFMMLGGLMLAVCVEYSGLHRRIALRIVLLVSTSTTSFSEKLDRFANENVIRASNKPSSFCNRCWVIEIDY